MPVEIDIALIALCNAQDEVLLLHRPSDVHCPDVWSFPGGKVESNETPTDAATRELKEETNISSPLKLLGTSRFNYPDRHLFFHLFSATYDIQHLQAESPHQWFKLKQLEKIEMPAANRQLIRLLLDI